MLDVGFGVGVNLSPDTELLVDVRYSRGFTNINSEDAGASRLYTRGIQPMQRILFTP